MKGGTARPAQGEDAKSELASLLSVLDDRLSIAAWLGGDEPSVADFSAYHPLWLHVNCSRRPLVASAQVMDWYRRIGELGHGQREDITPEQAFAAARDAEPRALPASIDDPQSAIGSTVEVAPSDYGVVAVTGTLVALTEERIILARDTTEFDKLHVHFPRVGYSIVVQA